MTFSRRHAAADAFFLNTAQGKRFCLYYAPAPGKACRGSILYVHPFAEEMNRTRRLAAQQARELAMLGFGVLQIDLLGCGDSEGEFRDASWDGWKKDLASAITWLTERLAAPVTLWGVRFGALLAMDFARTSTTSCSQLILWHPVLNGRSYLTQFLRLQIAAEIFSSDGGKRGDVASLRRALSVGETLELAGYDLTPWMAEAMESMDALEMTLPGMSMHWLEIVSEDGSATPASRLKVANHWNTTGARVHIHNICCPQFWSSQENVECPQLLAATCHILAKDGQ